MSVKGSSAKCMIPPGVLDPSGTKGMEGGGVSKSMPLKACCWT